MLPQTRPTHCPCNSASTSKSSRRGWILQWIGRWGMARQPIAGRSRSRPFLPELNSTKTGINWDLPGHSKALPRPVTHRSKANPLDWTEQLRYLIFLNECQGERHRLGQSRSELELDDKKPDILDAPREWEQILNGCSR